MNQPADILDILARAPVIPVLTVRDPARAVELAHCLSGAGLSVLEVTLRTESALEAIRAMRQALPDAIVGAGTILTQNDMARAQAAGAAFMVSPGFEAGLGAGARKDGIAYLPGVATASEVMAARNAGFYALKLFPADVAGGVAALKAFQPVFRDVVFCPTGGVNAANAESYLALANVICVGGSWVAPADLVEAGALNKIAALAEAASRLKRAYTKA